MAVVVKVTNQRHRDIHAIELLAYGGHLAGRLRRIDRNPDQLGTRLGQLFHLYGGGNGIGGIGVGHGLHHHGRICAHLNYKAAPLDSDSPCATTQRSTYYQWSVSLVPAWIVYNVFKDFSQSNIRKERSEEHTYDI